MLEDFDDINSEIFAFDYFFPHIWMTHCQDIHGTFHYKVPETEGFDLPFELILSETLLVCSFVVAVTKQHTTICISDTVTFNDQSFLIVVTMVLPILL